MTNKYFTKVPNLVFDKLLPNLTMAELKILLIIIRQTNGWLDKKTQRRKTRDRISHSQFIKKTGLSRRIVIATIQKLVDNKYIKVTDDKGQLLHCPTQRKGKRRLYYEALFQKECKIDKLRKPRKARKTTRKHGKVVTLKELLEQKRQALKLISK